MADYQEPRYLGALGKPLARYPKRPRPSAKVDDPPRIRWDAFFDEIYRRFLLLFRHFGIDPDAKDSWCTLAVALTQRHVPGLQVPENRGTGQPVGRRRTLDMPEAENARAELLVKVEELELKGKSESASLDYLRRHPRELPEFYVDMSGSLPSPKLTKSTLKQHRARAERERDARNARSGSLRELARILASATLEPDSKYQKLRSFEQERDAIERQLSDEAQARQARAQARVQRLLCSR